MSLSPHDILTSDEIFATTLIVFLMDQYTPDMLHWEPETLEAQVQQDFHLEMPQLTRDKIWAAATVLTTDAFYSDFSVFMNVCNVFNDDEAEFETLDIPLPEEVAWGVSEVKILDDDPDEDQVEQRFHPDIIAFMEAMLAYQGFHRPPESLWFLDPSKYADSSDTDLPAVAQAFDTVERHNLVSIDIYVLGRAQRLMHQLLEVPLQNQSSQQIAEFRTRCSELLRRAAEEETNRQKLLQAL